MAQQIGKPPLRQMVRPVVDHMATLTKALQVAKPVITRIVIEMRRGQHDTGVPYPRCLDHVGPTRCPSAVVAPSVPIGIEPASIR